MIPSEIKYPQKELIMNPIGYKEPHIDYLREMEIDSIDLIIVPGVVFDYFGNRIGFGGGYYDRFLNKGKGAYTIAVCYDYQLADRIPVDRFDVPVQCIVTEKKVIKVDNRKK
ncbi:MAG: 5-formyltetrahydrofolate cyclo-ligase [Candidatus Petromonas sp.]|jgi:5-formyltetrahydrofolate cyclo-ligase|nr:5-formyltetrahydrofolate cyclo-ligase [Candidatus Petromonas sp.]